ncbi:hypothetical protein RB195_009278 [Necator americanus]|uniref:Fibronectin type III domain protein n=1 Tax=Necator americanus TaxID=51031 RepID=A0ABR1CT99_NECAM
MVVRFRLVLALFAVSCGPLLNAESEWPPVSLNATVDSSLSIDVCVKANSSVQSPSSITGFKVYFTRNSIVSGEKFRQWQNIEVLTSESQYCIRLDAHNYDIRPATIYRLRATVLINQVESTPSRLILVNTKTAATKSPVIQSVKVLVNGSAVFRFINTEDADAVTNYTLEYRIVSSSDTTWTKFEFESGSSNEILISGLLPNRTYEARLSANRIVIHGHRSRTVTFTTNNTAQLPEVSLDPVEEVILDPDVSLPVEINCNVMSSEPSSIQWLVDGQPIQAEHSFYTVTSSAVDGQRTISTMHMKSRTRNNNVTCLAVNTAGQVSVSTAVRIRGPGSPPSAVTLQSERGGYTVAWSPPSHPNGNITKYVVYHSFNKEAPLSDWQKLVLDGTENSVRVMSNTEDSFYVRVQAAADSGPGVISDIVAVEKDTIPISISLQYEDPPDREPLVIDPGEKVKVRCIAQGKPRPQLLYVLAEQNENPDIEDVWRPLDTILEHDNVIGDVEFTTLSSKILHCKAKSTAGSNSSSLTFVVKKPGDAPNDIQVLSIDARDVIIAWKAPKFPNMKIESYEVLLNEDIEEDEEYWQKYVTTTKDDSSVLTRLSLPAEQLKPSHDYFIRVRAVNKGGTGPLSEAIKFTTPNGGPENPPTEVSIDINEANIAVVRWSKPNSTTEILNYVIYFTRDLGISNEDYREWQTVEVPATETTFKFDHQVGLKPKTFYRVRVSAKNDVAEGPVSETKEFETAHSELPIPTDIRTSVGEDNSLTITFSAVRNPDDHSSAIERYRIELAQCDDVFNAVWYPVNASSVSVDDMSSQVSITIDGSRLARSSMYWVKITAALDNPSRFVQASKPRWFRTGDGRLRTKAEIEGSPVMEKEPNLFETLRLVCRAEGNPSPDVKWYWNNGIIESEKEGWTVQQEQTEKSTVSVLTRGSVRESGVALCAARNEESNATAQIEVRVLGPGSAPRDVHAIGWRNQINVTWQEPLIANGVVMKYIVYYALQDATDLSDWEKFETDGTEIQLPASSPETRYLVRVQAATADGPGIISDSIECYSDKYYQAIVLDLVTTNINDFEAEPNQTVVLRCSARGQPIPRIFYAWDNDKENEITDVLITESTHHISGLFENSALTNRTVVCRAENKHESVNISRLLIVRKPGDVPTNITWSFDENDSLLIDWSRILYPNGNVTYILYLSNFVDRVSGPPVRIPQVPYNVNVTLQISAENEWGEGEKSTPVTFLTPHGGPRNAPTLTSLLSKDMKVTISWLPPTLPNGEIKGYTIYFKKSEESEEHAWQYVQVNANRTRFTIDESIGLEQDAHYKMKISATNERHEGPASEISWFDTYVDIGEDLPAPENVTAYLRNSSLVVHIPLKHAYQNFIIYVRPESSEQYWKYEAVNVTEAQETIIIRHFPLDKNDSYRMKISGFKHGRESRSSEEFALTVDSDPTEILPPRSDEGETTKAPASEKRRIVKEPPL